MNVRTTESKDDLLREVLEREKEMFMAVPTDGPCACKEDPGNFLVNRRAQFRAWSAEALESYRDDLVRARRAGRNLMTYKYARMAAMIPCGNDDPLVDAIVRRQKEWQEELSTRYPAFMSGARPLEATGDGGGQTSFETYLRAEVETFSAKTLARLFQEAERKQAAGVNMSEEIYGYLLQEKGLPPLAEMEKRMSAAR
jgi:hypothetical protein